MSTLHWLDPNDNSTDFPSVSTALKDPEGLLAAGGSLCPERLMSAYRRGIFPWYEEGQPILWWTPDPRAIILTDQLRITRSLKKTLRNRAYTVSFDTVFDEVVAACAAPRRDAGGTWITDDMRNAYNLLHQQGHAHSVEVWNEEGELVGGLYGVLLKKLFCGESMFSRAADMSKVAMVFLAEWLDQRNIHVIDCQLPNPHLMSMGAIEIPRDEFVRRYL